MANYVVEIESNAVAHVTGRLGVAVVTYRGHDYRVTLGGKEITRDGHPCGVDSLPKRVFDYAVKMYGVLFDEHRGAVG